MHWTFDVRCSTMTGYEGAFRTASACGTRRRTKRGAGRDAVTPVGGTGFTNAGRRYRGLVECMVAAALLDRRAYEEISADPGANGQAFVVVVLAGIFNGLGLVGRLGTRGMSAGVGAVLLSWFAWTAVIFVIAHLLRHRQDGRSLLRASALTNTPNLLLLLGVVPGIGGVVRVLVVAWQVAATVVAVQAVFGVPRRRAVTIALVALAVYLLMGVGLSYWLGDEIVPGTAAVIA